MRQIAAVARAEPANPFESVLRAIALRVPGLHVTPQVNLYADRVFLGRPDLVDEQLGMALEADSFEWHGGRAALRADARRYNALVVHGWMVLRFSWEDVMFHALEVEAVLKAAVAERAKAVCPGCSKAG